MSNVLVVIPTFDEIENIERLIRNIFSLQRKFDILVVDDNSPDGTAKVVKDAMECIKVKDMLSWCKKMINHSTQGKRKEISAVLKKGGTKTGSTTGVEA